jgi:hypothetical protein
MDTVSPKKSVYIPPKLEQHCKFTLSIGASPIRVPIQLLGEKGDEQ